MALAAFSDKQPFRLDGRQYQCEALMDSLLFASAFVPSTTRNAPNAFLIESRRFRRASIFGRKQIKVKNRSHPALERVKESFA